MKVFKMYKNSFKLEQKRGRFLVVSLNFYANFLLFENALTSNDAQRGCHDVFRGHGTLKKQKIAEKLRQTAKKRPLLPTQGDSTS